MYNNDIVLKMSKMQPTAGKSREESVALSSVFTERRPEKSAG